MGLKAHSSRRSRVHESHESHAPPRSKLPRGTRRDREQGAGWMERESRGTGLIERVDSRTRGEHRAESHKGLRGTRSHCLLRRVRLENATSQALVLFVGILQPPRQLGSPRPRQKFPTEVAQLATKRAPATKPFGIVPQPCWAWIGGAGPYGRHFAPRTEASHERRRWK